MHKTLPEKYSQLIDNLWFDKKLWSNIEAVNESKKYTYLLSKNPNIELFIITATHPKIIQTKIEWLNKNFPWFTYDHIIVSSNKQIFKMDVMIDDAIHNLEGGKYHKVLFSYPWNENYPAKRNGMIRVHKWEEIYNYIIDRLHAKKLVYELEH